MSVKPKDRAYRPLVYICSPLSGNVKRNIENAKKYGRLAIEKGMIPVIPHLMYCGVLNDEDPEERELALFIDIVLLGKCDTLLVCGDTLSEGMKKEIEIAKKRRQPIRYFNGDFEEVESL